MKEDIYRCHHCKKETVEENRECEFCTGPIACYCGECSGVKAVSDFNFRDAICNCDKEPTTQELKNEKQKYDDELDLREDKK